MVTLVTSREKLRQTELRHWGVIPDAANEAERNGEKIRTALLSKAADGGGVLRLPAGRTIHVSGDVPIRTGVTLEGYGAEASILHLHDDGHVEANGKVAGDDIKHFALRNFTLLKDEEADPQNPMIHLASQDTGLNRCNQFVIDGVHADATDTPGGQALVGSILLLNAAFTGTIMNSKFRGADVGAGASSLGHFGIKTGTSIDGTNNNNNINFLNCNFQGNDKAGWLDSCRGIAFRSCAFQGSDIEGLTINRSNECLLLENCWFESNDAVPLYIGRNANATLYNENVVVRNCHFTEGVEYNAAGIYLYSYSYDTYIYENYASSFATAFILNQDAGGADTTTGGYSRNTLAAGTPTACDTDSTGFTAF